MNETLAQYAARIASYVEGKDSLSIQHQSYQTLARLVEGVPEEALVGQCSPGKWSVREILAHLAEAEIVSTWRYRQMIEQNGVALTAFDQDEWARLGDFGATDVRESLEIFRLLRQNNLRMFARLTHEEWQRFGRHSERGKMTLEDLVRQMAGHDLNHIQQVRQILTKT